MLKKSSLHQFPFYEYSVAISSTSRSWNEHITSHVVPDHWPGHLHEPPPGQGLQHRYLLGQPDQPQPLAPDDGGLSDDQSGHYYYYYYYYHYCLMTCTEPAPRCPGQGPVSGSCSKASQCCDSRDCHECHEHYSFMSRVWQRQGVWFNWNIEQRKLATDGFTRLLESGDSCFILGVGRKYPPNRWPSLRQFNQQKIRQKIFWTLYLWTEIKQ